ncbi:DUF3052 family protein [soil metagenome]
MTARASAPAGRQAPADAKARAGYSGTPLAKKLGIATGDEVFLVEAPANYRELVAPLPDGVRFVARMGSETDIVHVFATQRARLEKGIAAARAKLKSDGVIWASWPKKSSKVATDITEDTVREIALPMGLVDVKVCAVDDVWSGLKLVIRRENRPSRT